MPQRRFWPDVLSAAALLCAGLAAVAGAPSETNWAHTQFREVNTLDNAGQRQPFHLAMDASEHEGRYFLNKIVIE